jgi:hypothetical protein
MGLSGVYTVLLVIVPLHALDTVVQSHDLRQSLGQGFGTKLARKHSKITSILLRAALVKVSIMGTPHPFHLSPICGLTNRSSDLILTPRTTSAAYPLLKPFSLG